MHHSIPNRAGKLSSWRCGLLDGVGVGNGGSKGERTQSGNSGEEGEHEWGNDGEAMATVAATLTQRGRTSDNDNNWGRQLWRRQ